MFLWQEVGEALGICILNILPEVNILVTAVTTGLVKVNI